MSYSVILTDDAVLDLEEIYAYILQMDGELRADQVLGAIQETLEKLDQFPDSGAYVNELKTLGMTEFRQIFYKPYRIIYRVMNKRVIIYVITDGRRDMQTHLSRRLLSR